MTDRDFTLIDLLGRHRVFTIDQITGLLFSSTRSARNRITRLLDLDLIDRWRTAQRPGSQAFRHTLGYTGAYLYSAARGLPVPRRVAFQHQQAELVASANLSHRLAVNDFFARLTQATKDRPDLALHEWLSESEAGALTGGLVRPDAAATITGADDPVEFWFEHDRGTETLHRVVEKVGRYRTRLPSLHRALVFELTSEAREDHLHAALAGTEPHFTVATATADRTTDPTKAIWRILHRPGLRRLDRLTDPTS
ncbi:replication-relaxation family protein [Glycomyces arizonensis]|uniref:replication-relaxation family protein n=1 Tax=Glycomyces arizonensis TaxID=256035 RepID=UPI00041F68A8|nr:replication-relaxation family protein [Glycomyces arizonensis]